MRSVFRVFVFLLLTGCGFPQSTLPHTTQIKLPDFVDDPKPGINEDIGAPIQKLIYYGNYGAMKEILKHDPAVVREEMLKRLSPAQPMSLRLIAATVLVLKNDEEGQKFFLTQSKMSKDLGDLYVTFDHLVWSAEWLSGTKVDLSWAQDMMIEALQNRTRINRRDALDLPRNVSWDETIEIREMAVQYGHFSDHLVRMRSEKALPIILALLRENPFYGLNTCIGYLGVYRDERVASLLLDELTNYRDSKSKDAYRFAVGAASDMGLKSAVPILLRHLNDEDSYRGLVALGDASVVPAIKAALPRLKSDAHAEAELAIVHLQGGDVLPPLLRLLRRNDFLKRHAVIDSLTKLKDPRSVPAMTSMLCYDSDSYVRSGAIWVLTAVRNKEAIQGLINGLGCDYSRVKRFKTNSDYDSNSEYRGNIAKALQEITGENFGIDQKRWTLWLNQQTAYRFTPGQSSVRVPIELANDLIVLTVRVKSSRPLHFIFDTGASISVIDPQTAKALGLRAKGKLKLDATGGSVQSGLIGPVSLSLAGVTVFKQTLATIDLDAFAPLFGYKIDGIIGHDFINNFVVEIDYAAGLMSLYETGSYKYAGPGESISIEMVEKTPFVRGRIMLNGREPIEGKFEVDTGATGILFLNTPFVNKHKILETLTTQAQSKLGGAGGSAAAVKAHVPAVDLGGLSVKNPLVVLAQGTEGSESKTEYDGELGAGFFSQFKMILDYSRSQMILERTVSTTRDLSGLDIVAEPPRFRTYVVNGVAADSPASAVGVQEEDTIVAVDGRPTARLTLRELRRLFTHAGERVVSVRRGSETIRLRLRLQ